LIASVAAKPQLANDSKQLWLPSRGLTRRSSRSVAVATPCGSRFFTGRAEGQKGRRAEGRAKNLGVALPPVMVLLYCAPKARRINKFSPFCPSAFL